LKKLLELLEYVRSKQLGQIDQFPLWALFIAGCVAMEDQRSTVLGLFTDLKKSVSNILKHHLDLTSIADV